MGLLTAAQLGLLEAGQGLGVQGAGVSTERALRQLQGAVAGPGKQPAQVAIAGQELGAEVPAEGGGTQGRAEGFPGLPGWGWSPRERQRPERANSVRCVGAPCGALRLRPAQRPPRLLRRLATWSQCLCVPLLAEEGSRGLGKGYSHRLKGGQLIKDPRLQTGEDVSRYVSAGEQGDGILGSPWAGGEP